jgi:hypothetical protein
MTPNKLFSVLAVVVLAVAGTRVGAQTARPAPLHAWAPVPLKPAPYGSPNKPLKKIADILARHVGQGDWSETEVLTRDYVGDYVSMAPGKKTKTLF